MVQPVPLNKRSKKAQRKYHAKQRGSWYGLGPITRTVPSGKVYDRNQVNERLTALLEKPEKGPGHSRRTGRRYRRRKGQEKTDRRLAIVQLSGYAPHRGYVDWEFEGKTLLHTGKHIKYPKNSKCQRWLKRVSNKKVRACLYLPQKGNGYRKVFDYWWTLY